MRKSKSSPSIPIQSGSLSLTTTTTTTSSHHEQVEIVVEGQPIIPPPSTAADDSQLPPTAADQLTLCNPTEPDSQTIDGAEADDSDLKAKVPSFGICFILCLQFLKCVATVHIKMVDMLNILS